MITKVRGARSLVGLLATLVAVLCGPAANAAAAPADPLPTAPLTDLTPGETCEARTVMKGTAITAFPVKILDVVQPGSIGFGSLIYFEVTDPQIAEVGVAEGMSGSPILCQIAGEEKVVGAISYGFDGVGPKGFATPINDILEGQPSPATMRAKVGELPRYGGRKLVELSPPLTVSGVPQVARNRFRKKLAARGYESVNFAAPAPVDVPADSSDLAPGGAFSINYAFGDVTIGAICTISYRNGDDFWGCGHPLDLAGERSISFSGAYIYDVLGQSWGATTPFKLGTATPTQVGSVLYDGPYAVSGKFGRPAAGIPVRVNYRSGGSSVSLQSKVVNEYKLPGGPPTGTDLSVLIGPVMVAQAQFSQAGQPLIQNGRICMKQTILGAGRQVQACSRFASSSPAWMYAAFGEPSGAAFPTDFLVGGLGMLLGQVKYRTLYPGSLKLDVEVNTGSALRQIIGLRPIGNVRIGERSRIAVISASRDGQRHRQIVPIRVPRRVKVGKGKSVPMRKGRVRIEAGSGAFFGGSPAEGLYLATDNDAAYYYRLMGGLWSGRGSIESPKELDETIQGVFQKKAKLTVYLPWRRDPVLVPLRGGGDVVVGGSSGRIQVLPASGKRSSRAPIR